ALGAREPRRPGELALVAWVVERWAHRAVLEDRGEHRLGVEVVGYPALPGEVERFARCRLSCEQRAARECLDRDLEADRGEIRLDDLRLLSARRYVAGVEHSCSAAAVG